MYNIYHETYSSCISEMMKHVENNGFTVSSDEVFSEITTGNGKPNPGETVRHSLLLFKHEKTTNKFIHAQVYNMGRDRGNTFELNMYFS